MKKLVGLLAVVASVSALAATENSILYPKQIQTKLTLEQWCNDDEIKKLYHSVDICIETQKKLQAKAIEQAKEEREEQRAQRVLDEVKALREEVQGLQYEQQRSYYRRELEKLSE